MKIKVERLRKVLRHIVLHPDTHDQATWGSKTACGTTHCLAGHAAVTFAGYSPVWSDRRPWGEDGGMGRILIAVRAEAGMPQVGIRHAAQGWLGLSDYQGDRMFLEAATARELWQLASDFTDGKIDMAEFDELESEVEHAGVE